MSINTTAESLVNPTEDPAKVERALSSLFPSAPIKRTNISNDVFKVAVSGNGLEFLKTLRNLIRQERIRTAARKILLNGTSGNQVQFYLNKQAAFVSRISFCEPVGESPLGPISIRIDSTDPLMIIEFLASRPGQDSFRSFQSER